jgi:hypothetical protein
MKNIPAFPVSFKWGMELRPYNGMTLRDYFAAKAMQGLLASEVHAPLKAFAKQAYATADAMMEVRNESQ